MVELLIKAVDATNIDPDKSVASCFKRGDLVVIMPDSHSWGRQELNTEKFSIVRLPGVPRERVEHLLEEDYTDEEVGTDREGNPVFRKEIYRKRLRNINLDSEATINDASEITREALLTDAIITKEVVIRPTIIAKEEPTINEDK